MKCPKCNLKVSPTDKKCPFCETKIKKLKDNIEKLPEIIDEPNKITTEESLEKEIKYKFKEIPLKVKKVTAPRKEKKEGTKKEIKKSKQTKKDKNQVIEKLRFQSSIKIVIVLLLLLINIFLITKIVIDTETQTQPLKQSVKNNIEHLPSTIIGTWRSSNNGLFVFQDNENFYWYDSYENQNDNYFTGTFNYKKGLEAVTEMGYTKEEFEKTFGKEISMDNVYSMNLIPTISYKNGKNNTDESIKENESWWYILIIKDKENAIAYNKTLDLRYNLLKY